MTITAGLSIVARIPPPVSHPGGSGDPYAPKARFHDLLERLRDRADGVLGTLGPALPVPAAGVAEIARVFNEDGLFGAVVPDMTDAAAPAKEIAASQERSSVPTVRLLTFGGEESIVTTSAGTAESGSPAMLAVMPVPLESIAAAGDTAPIALVGRSSATPLAGAMPIGYRLTIATMPVSKPSPVPDAGDSVAADATAGRADVGRNLADRAAASNVTASLQPTDQGLNVTARLVGFASHDVTLLRGRIAALLARYGLAARVVRLNGQAAGALASAPDEIAPPSGRER